jgi:hypothetical protein
VAGAGSARIASEVSGSHRVRSLIFNLNFKIKDLTLLSFHEDQVLALEAHVLDGDSSGIRPVLSS